MMRYLLLVIWCVLGSFQGIGQQVSVTAGFSNDTILIGNTVDYTLTFKTRRGIEILEVAKSSLDSIISGIQTQKLVAQDTTVQPDPIVSDYTILDYGKWDDKNEDGIFSGQELSFDQTIAGADVLYENTLRIQFWDPGPQYIKHPPIKFRSQDSLYQMGVSGVASVYIAPPFDEAEMESDSFDIAPIKPIIFEAKDISDYYIYMYLGLAILAFLIIGFLIKWLNRPKLVEEVHVEVIRPAHEIALEKLHDLGDKKLWQTGEVKEYQSELTYIIREYLENRYDIKALESTTDEIVTELSQKEFDPTDERNLREILQVADLVKFAKAKPEMSIHEKFLDSAKGFVRKTKEVVIEQAANEHSDSEQASNEQPTNEDLT